MEKKLTGRYAQEWSSILLSWVNYLEDETLARLSAIKNSRFFLNIIKEIYLNEGEDITFKNNEECLNTFLKDYYPEFQRDKKINIKHDEDVIILVALIMYTSCIRCKIENIVNKTCTFNTDNNSQEILKNFFELMMDIRDGRHTRKNVLDAIHQSLGSTNCASRKSVSPSGPATCLKDFLASPTVSERRCSDNELKRLKALLEEEQTEKAEILEKNQLLEESIKKLNLQLSEKVKEINSLKEELIQYMNESSDSVPKEDHEKSFIRENSELKNDLKYLQSENDSLMKETEKYLNQVKNLSEELNYTKYSLEEKIKHCYEDQLRLNSVLEEKVILENQIKELQQIIEQYKEESKPKEELDLSIPRVEENLGDTVIDLQLREKDEVIERLQKDISTLQQSFSTVCQEKAEEIERLETARQYLEEQLQSKCVTIQSLEEKLRYSLAENKEKEEKLIESLKTNEQLNCLVAEKESQVEKFKVLVQSLSDEKRDFEVKVEYQAEELKTLETTRQSLEEQLQRQFYTIESLEEKLRDSLAGIKEKEEKLIEFSLTNEQLNVLIVEKDSQIENLKVLVQSLSDEKRDYQLTVAHQSGEIKQLEITKQDLQSKLDLKCKEADDLSHINSNLREQISVAENNMKMCTTQIENLLTKNNTLDKELNSVLTKSKQMEKKLSESSQTIEQLNCAVVYRDSQLTELQNLTKTLSEEKKEFQSVIEQQVEKMKNLEELKKSLECTLEAKASEMEVLSSNFHSIQEQLSVAVDDLGVSNQQNIKLTSENDELNEQLRQLVSQVKDLQDKLFTSEQTVENLSTEIGLKEAQICEIQSRILTLEKEKHEIMSAVVLKEDEFEKLEIKNKESSSTLETKNKEIEDLKLTNSDLEKKLSLVEDDLQLSKKENECLIVRLDKLDGELRCAQSHVEQLEEKLVESNNNCEKLSATLLEKESYVIELTKMKQTLEDERNVVQANIEHQKNVIKQLESSVTFSKTALEETQKEVEVLNLTISELNESLATVEDDLQLSKKENECLIARLDKLGGELQCAQYMKEQLEKQLDEANNNYHQLSATLLEKESKCAELTNMKEIVEDERNVAQATVELQLKEIRHLESSKDILEQTIQHKLTEIEKLSEMCSNLREQLVETERNSVIHKKESDALSCEVDNMDKELNMKSKLVEEMKEKLTEYQNNEDQLKVILAKNESELSKLYETLDKNQDILSQQAEAIKLLELCKLELEEALKRSTADVETLKNECSNLKEELISYMNDLQQYKQENECLLKEKSELNTKFNEILSFSKETEEKLEHLRIVVDNKDSLLSELKFTIKTLEKEKNTLEASSSEQIAVIQSKLEVTENEISKKELIVTELEKENSELCKKLAENELFVLNLQSEYNNMSSMIAELNSQLDSVRAAATHLENVVQEDNFKIEHLESTIKKQETVIHEQKGLIKQSKDEILHLQKELSDLNQLTSEKESKLQSLTDQLNSKDSEIIRLKEEVEKAIYENEKLHEEFKKVALDNEKFEEEKLSLASCLSDINKKFETAQTLLSASQTEVAEKESIICDLQRQLKEKETTELLAALENQKSNEALVNERNRLKKFLEELESELKIKTEKIMQLEEELPAVRKKAEQYQTELEIKYKQLNDLHETHELDVNKLNEQINSLKQQIEQNDPQLKEAYDKLFYDFHRLNEEHDSMVSEYKTLSETHKNVRAEYEGKLKIMKDHMKSTCSRVLKEEEEKHERKMKELQEVVKSNQDHITQLSSQLWDTSDKLLITKTENEELRKKVSDLKRALSLNQSVPEGIHRTRSYDQIGMANQEMRVVDESVTVTRRQSIRTVPSGIGKVFPSEDEAEEMFNNECLADLKAGRCQVQTSDPNRLSTLKYRNSLCPPHLKSSYPAETQFLPMDMVDEDDIKGKGGGDDPKNAPEKRRKDRLQAYEHRTATTPRNALRELNDGNKKPGTPSRLFSHFFSSKNRDENMPSTPNHRRLSFFNRHFMKKEPSE